jgi:glycosyltransferase involved in cell wall biosynthesis
VLADLAGRGWRPDAAFCNTVASSEAAEALHKAGVPVVSAVYELPTSIDDALGGRRTIERVMRSSRRVMVASAFVRDRLSAAYEIDADRLEPVHTGVLGRQPTDRDGARRRIREELGVDEETVVVLGCGSVHHRKGTDLFVAAAGRAVSELSDGAHGRVVFAWVGDDQSGPTFRNWCRHDIERAGLGDVVRLVGKKPDPSAWFAGADVFALTSREDPFPMVNLEAMRAGLAVVAFADAGGATEVLTRDRGVVVPYADAAAMGTAIAAIVRDPHAMARLGRRAGAFAAEELSWDRYMGAINGMLASCSDRFGSRADAARAAEPEHAGS